MASQLEDQWGPTLKEAAAVGDCPSSAQMADEIFTSYTLPGGKKVTDAVDEYFRMVIREGQKVADLIDKAQKEVSEEWYPGCRLMNRDLIGVLQKHIAQRSPWGNDPMTKLWARALVTGDMLF